MDGAEAEAVLRLAGPQPRESALDAGCGTGIYTRRLIDRGAIVTGVDSDPQMLAAARAKALSARLIEGDVGALPLESETFDLTLAVTLLCFVADPQRAVSVLVRVTRPGGRVLLAELGRFSLWAAGRRIKGWRGSETWAGAHFFTPCALAGLLRHAGAQRIQTASAAYLPPPAPGWLLARAPARERRGKRLGALGAALVLACGELVAL
jgi:SAM-dependent methyltransferase